MRLIVSNIARIAEIVLRQAGDDSYQYIHDPDHRNRPHGTFWPTDKGWSNDPKDDPKVKQSQKTKPQNAQTIWRNPHVDAELEESYNRALESNDMYHAQSIVDELAKRSGYDIVDMYHGTTHDFTEFNTRNANVENDLGKGFYFTNSSDDAGSNYVGIGPDLTSRVEQFVDRNENDEDLLDLFERRKKEGKIKKDADFRKFLTSVAKKHLVGKKKRLMNVALSLKNPAVLEKNGGTFLDYNSGYNEESEEYEDEPSGTLVDFINAINMIGSGMADYSAEDEVNGVLEEFMGGDDIPLSEVIEKLKKSESFSISMYENGEMSSGEIIRQALQQIGFDGIVDRTVNDKFGDARKFGRAMDGVNADTEHVIMFNPNQIKSQDPFTMVDPKKGKSHGNIIPLSQRFNLQSKDIRY